MDYPSAQYRTTVPMSLHQDDPSVSSVAVPGRHIANEGYMSDNGGDRRFVPSRQANKTGTESYQLQRHQPTARTRSAPSYVNPGENVNLDNEESDGKFRCSSGDVIEFLGQKVQVSYLLILLAGLGCIFMLIVVGVAAGIIGQNRSALSAYDASIHESAKRSLEGVDVNDVATQKPWTYYRLPKTLKPISYDIEMRPYFYNDHDAFFTGDVTMEVKVIARTTFVLFHAKEVNISSTKVFYSNPRHEIGIESVKYHKEFDYVILKLNQVLQPNRTILVEAEFRGSLANTYEGFYKAPFRNPGSSGPKMYAVVTQFEPLAARKAFPCFDEPDLKALFKVSILHKAEVTAFSNMPLENKVIGNLQNEQLPVHSSFEKTSVPMSTYLVAFVVGPYHRNAPCRATSNGLKICAQAPEYLMEQTQYSLDTAVSGMEWFQDFFGIPYPLPKVDLIVYPSFRSMAMENWGLISFREEAMLVSPRSTSFDKELVNSVVLHELAHMWFGNVVTMKWWDDLWLNEGFASYMEYPASWYLNRLKDNNEYNDVLRAMSGDGMRSTRAIRAHGIKTGTDIGAAFDGITYSKGCSIIRMLVGALGMPTFRAGIRLYMQRHRYGNAKTEQLWQSFSKLTSIDVATAMGGWVEQKGYPLVTVEYGTGQNQLVLRQERFLLPEWKPEGHTVEAQPPARWHIPIVYKLPGQVNSTTKWFLPESMPFIINNLNLQGTSIYELKVNIGQTAFIRVNYPIATWRRFAELLKSNIDKFEPIDRAGLISDSFELAKSGRLPYTVVFELTQFLARETKPVVWTAFARQFRFLRTALAETPTFGKFEKFFLGIMRSARLATLNSPAIETLAKRKTLAILGSLTLSMRRKEEIQCYSEYFRRDTWHQPENIDIRRSVLTAAVFDDDSEATINQLLRIANETKQQQLRKTALSAVAKTKHTWLLIRELQQVFSGGLVTSEFLTLAKSANHNAEMLRFMWNWARENFDALLPIFGGKSRNFMRWVVGIPSSFRTQTQFTEFQQFIQKVGDFGQGERPKQLALESIRINIHWQQKLLQSCEDALDAMDSYASTLINTPVSC